MVLSRETIKAGLVDEIMAEAVRLGVLDRWTEDEREENRRQTLAQNPSEDVWIFGYGSLMWNPTFHFEQKQLCRLYGYHRAFCLWAPVGRGTPENPGLLLGLERGGSCNGIAFRVHPDRIEEETRMVWQREMPAGSYIPRWVQLNDGPKTCQAIAFVINPHQPRYASGLGFEEIAQSIATAGGRLGSSAEYLGNTVNALNSLHVVDHHLQRLWHRVQEIQASGQNL